MNIRSGLFRAWLALSITWIGYSAWHSDIACPLELIRFHTGAGGVWCKIQNARPMVFYYYGNLALKMVGIPALAFAAFAAANWIWRGIRSTPEKSRTRDSA